MDWDRIVHFIILILLLLWVVWLTGCSTLNKCDPSNQEQYAQDCPDLKIEIQVGTF